MWQGIDDWILPTARSHCSVAISPWSPQKQACTTKSSTPHTSPMASHRSIWSFFVRRSTDGSGPSPAQVASRNTAHNWKTSPCSTDPAGCARELPRRLSSAFRFKAIHIQSIGVPLSVQDAFLDVISASEEQTAIINKAEAYAASAIPIALGEASATHHRSEAKALQITRRSEAQSTLFQAHFEGGQKAPALTYDRLYMDHLARHFAVRSSKPHRLNFG